MRELRLDALQIEAERLNLKLECEKCDTLALQFLSDLFRDPSFDADIGHMLKQVLDFIAIPQEGKDSTIQVKRFFPLV